VRKLFFKGIWAWFHFLIVHDLLLSQKTWLFRIPPFPLQTIPGKILGDHPPKSGATMRLYPLIGATGDPFHGQLRAGAIVAAA